MDWAQWTTQDFSGFQTCLGVVPRHIIWGLLPPLLLGVYNVVNLLMWLSVGGLPTAA